MRVVITEHGILWKLAAFFETAKRRHRSAAWQQKTCRSVGLLYDWTTAVPAPTESDKRVAYLSDFVAALMSGTIGEDGSDATGLRWHPMGWSGVKEVIEHVNQYGDYCLGSSAAPNLNPTTAASFTERVAAYRQLDVRNEQSLLKHLGTSREAHAKAHTSRSVTARRSPRIAKQRPVSFPAGRFAELLSLGFRRREKGRPWEQHSVRDQMLVLLERHGGIRPSEAFNLFVTDVLEDGRNPSHAEVRVYHPELGRFRYLDPQTQKPVEMTRLEFLRLRYQRIPRSLMTGPQRAGWKNLMLEFGAPNYYTVVRWFPQRAARDFWALYRMYMRHVYPAGIAGHPYLFVTLDHEENRGQPYQLGAYYKNLRTAVRRIGLPPAKVLGTSSHGLRHSYAQDLKDSGVERKIIQMCLHHTSAASQDVYGEPEAGTISRALEEAWQRLQSNPRTHQSLPVHDEPSSA